MKDNFKIVSLLGLLLILGLFFQPVKTESNFYEENPANQIQLNAASFVEAREESKKPDVARIEKDALEVYEAYKQVVNDTVNMVRDQRAVKIANTYGLSILNVTWEDTGRYKNSAVGPNISDMSIQVQMQNPKTQQYSLHVMPVIRFPNFSDKTCDVPLDKFYLLVGNEKNRPLKKITLKEYLENFRSYLHDPNSWKGNNKSLLAKRDTHALVSAQACFLPIPKKGSAEFNPVLFNYQSYKNNPAVLTILVTREGTSATIIDNTRDAFSAGRTWGQRLFFNKNGERAGLTGTRLSDYIEEKSQEKTPDGKSAVPSKEEQEGLNMVLLIQVPLKHTAMRPPAPTLSMAESAPAGSAKKESARQRSDVEAAVIGHGKVEGPFTEIDGLEIERDERFPVRVTIQFYKATSNGYVTHQDMNDIAKQIDKVYDSADYVGSLVVEGETKRPTEYFGPKEEPPFWWESFWNQYEEQFGISRQEAIEMLRKIYGPQWRPRNRQDLDKKLEELRRNR